MKTNEIDRYIADFPKETQLKLEEIRAIIKKAAPQSEEVISYKMPAYKLNGMLVWFAGYKGHIGFYPSAAPIVIFKEQLIKYKTSKGAIQFQMDKPLPAALITKIVKYKVKDNQEKLKAKKTAKK